jgi:DNA-binding transcriptional MerR regulator
LTLGEYLVTNEDDAPPETAGTRADAMDAEGQFLSVTQLAKELHVTPRALRFYEDKGLLSPKRAGNTRVYTYRDRARMIIILRGKRLGFSLRDIKDYLDLYEVDRTQGKQLALLLKLVRGRVDRLKDQRVALEEALSELADVERQVITALDAHNQKTSAGGA